MCKKRKTTISYVLVSFYIVLVVFLLLQNKYIESNQKITVQSCPNSGEVTFRGAIVDENWYGIQSVVISSEGWVLNEEVDTLTDTTGNALELKLPIGMKRTLIFNVGPEEGIVDVYVNQNLLEWNLYREKSIDFGEEFQLPYVRFSNKIKLNMVAIFILVLLTAAMLAANLYLKRRNPQDRKIQNNKNSAIEFMRFFFIMAVVLHHFFWYSSAGYLAVDFFFLLSGFLLMQYYTKDTTAYEAPALAAVKYTEKRYFRLLPYYLFAFFLSLAAAAVLWEGISFDSLTDSFWELFMLESFGFTENLAVGPGWYCSALIIAGFLIYFLLAKYQKTYLYIIAPISLFLIFVWMHHNIGNLNRWLQIDLFISTGTLRGFADISLGCISYQIYSVGLSKKWGNIVVNTILELACFSFIVYIIFKVGPSAKDFVCVFAMAVLIISLFLEKSVWYRILNNRLSFFFGSISISIYLNHIVLQKMHWYEVCSHFGLSWNITLLIYLFIVIFFCGFKIFCRKYNKNRICIYM